MKFIVHSASALNFLHIASISSLFTTFPPNSESIYLVNFFMVVICVTTFKKVDGCYMNNKLKVFARLWDSPRCYPLSEVVIAEFFDKFVLFLECGNVVFHVSYFSFRLHILERAVKCKWCLGWTQTIFNRTSIPIELNALSQFILYLKFKIFIILKHNK